jgi:hypothetical protein
MPLPSLPSTHHPLPNDERRTTIVGNIFLPHSTGVLNKEPVPIHDIVRPCMYSAIYASSTILYPTPQHRSCRDLLRNASEGPSADFKSVPFFSVSRYAARQHKCETWEEQRWRDHSIAALLSTVTASAKIGVCIVARHELGFCLLCLQCTHLSQKHEHDVWNVLVPPPFMTHALASPCLFHTREH